MTKQQKDAVEVLRKEIERLKAIVKRYHVEMLGVAVIAWMAALAICAN